MIKDIQTVSESYNFSNVILYEKLDMFYFKVIINSTTCTILSHKHKIITKSDIIINSMWKDITEFVNNNIKSKQSIIAQKYNHLIIGFFYCPVEKPLSISYNNFLNNKNANNKFIIGSIKNDKNEEIDISDFCINVNLMNVRGIGGGPIIDQFINVDNLINDYAHKKISKGELISQLTNKIKSFSGNDLGNIEGIIIKDNKNIYQIIFNESRCLEMHNRYNYESIITDFLDKWDSIILNNYTNYNDKDDAYQQIISDVFIQYIQKSDKINNIKDPLTLLPPGNCYIGDLSYDLITNKNIETFCKLNEVYKNVFRILYKGLQHHKKHTKYNKLSDACINKWNDIVNIIANAIH